MIRSMEWLWARYSVLSWLMFLWEQMKINILIIRRVEDLFSIEGMSMISSASLKSKDAFKGGGGCRVVSFPIFVPNFLEFPFPVNCYHRFPFPNRSQSFIIIILNASNAMHQNVERKFVKLVI